MHKEKKMKNLNNASFNHTAVLDTIPSQHRLSIDQIIPDIKNQLNYMLGNSQIILDIWKEVDKILAVQTAAHPDEVICGIPLTHLSRVVAELLKDIIQGTLKINNFVRIIKDMSDIEAS